MAQKNMGLSDEQMDLLFGSWTINKMRETTEP
jgi:hypothetical protein